MMTQMDIDITMSRGVFKVVFSRSRRRYALKVLRENTVLFAAEGSRWEIPVRMFEEHAAYLMIVAAALREMLRGMPMLEEVVAPEQEGEQEES